MIAGQVTDGVRRIELTSGHDSGNYKLPSQYGAHLYPALARLPAHSHGAWSRGVAIDLMAKAKEFEELYAR